MGRTTLGVGLCVAAPGLATAVAAATAAASARAALQARAAWSAQLLDATDVHCCCHPSAYGMRVAARQQRRCWVRCPDNLQRNVQQVQHVHTQQVRPQCKMPNQTCIKTDINVSSSHTVNSPAITHTSASLLIILATLGLCILVRVHDGVLVARKLACNRVYALLEEPCPPGVCCLELSCFLLLRVQLLVVPVKQVHCSLVLLLLAGDDYQACSSSCNTNDCCYLSCHCCLLGVLLLLLLPVINCRLFCCETTLVRYRAEFVTNVRDSQNVLSFGYVADREGIGLQV